MGGRVKDAMLKAWSNKEARFATFALITALLVVSWYLVNFYASGRGDQEAFALFGDFLGGVLNPLFGFFTIVLLLSSLRIQGRELAITNQELKDTNRMHQKNLDFHKREIVWPRLWERFQLASMHFDSLWEKNGYNFDSSLLSAVGFGVSLKAHTLSFLEERYLIQKENLGFDSNIPDATLEPLWSMSKNMKPAKDSRRYFVNLINSSLGVIRYSETSIETQEVVTTFAAAHDRMKNLCLIDGARLQEADKKIKDALAEREASSEFPFDNIGQFRL